MKEQRLSPELGGFRPTARQELLLRAALLPTAEAGAAWSEWATDSAMDNLDEGSYRLLPLVYRNLKAQGIQHRLMGTLKGLYRRAWYENQLLFHRTAGVLESLRKAGIPTLLLKGAALALEYYKDLGARPMSDLDFLVPEEKAVAACALLEAAGWRRTTAAPAKLTASFLRARHALGMEHEAGGKIDLHWHVLYWTCFPGADRDFWADSVPADLLGETTRTLNPADQLLHACVHGVDWNEVSPVRWIPDALAVMGSAPSLDWDRIVRQAERRRLGLHLEDTLGYLRANWGAPVPEEVLRSLSRLPVSEGELWEYRRLTNPQDTGGVISNLRSQFHAGLRSARGNRLRAWIDLPRFMRYWMGLPSWWEVFRMALRWPIKRVRRAWR